MAEMDAAGVVVARIRKSGLPIRFASGRFVLESVGQLTPAQVRDRARRGALVWADDSARSWFEVTYPEPVPRSAPPNQSAPPAVTPTSHAVPVGQGRGYFIWGNILCSLTAALCVAYYPFRSGGGAVGVLGYLVDAFTSLWWIGGLACAYAARRRGRRDAVRVASLILGIALALGAMITLAQPAAR